MRVCHFWRGTFTGRLRRVGAEGLPGAGLIQAKVIERLSTATMKIQQVYFFAKNVTRLIFAPFYHPIADFGYKRGG